MAQFEVLGKTYRTGRVDARRQFHIVRRLAPVFAELSAAGRSLAQKGGMDAAPDLFFDTLAPSLAKMPEADVDYVIDAALAVTQRLEGQAWANMLAPNGAQMFADTDMGVLLRIVAEFLKENLGGFFGAPSDVLGSLLS